MYRFLCTKAELKLVLGVYDSHSQHPPLGWLPSVPLYFVPLRSTSHSASSYSSITPKTAAVLAGLSAVTHPFIAFPLTSSAECDVSA